MSFENDGKITLTFADRSGELIRLPDLKAYLSEQKNNISEFGERLIDENISDYLKRKLNDYVECLLKEGIIKVPKNLNTFFVRQRPLWIDNVIEALHHLENTQYVVHDGQIKPVDYHSNGIIQGSTNWCDGLHQFLQLKELQAMSSETLTTNFLSNVGLRNGYKKVFGLTGTLGSEKARKVLKVNQL